MNLLSPAHHVKRHSSHSLPTRLTRTEKSYLIAYLLSLIICLSPMKAASYLTPFLAISVFVLLSQKLMPGLRFSIMVFAALELILLNAAIRDGFILHSGLYSIITYGSFLFIAAIPNKTVRSPRLFERMIPWIKRVVVVEAILGTTQWLYNFITMGGVYPLIGDTVEGTIAPGLGSGGAFSSPMLIINLVFLTLGLLYRGFFYKRTFVIFIMGMSTMVLALVLHVLIFLILAFLCSIFLFLAKGTIRKYTLAIVTLTVGFSLLIFWLYPIQVSHIFTYGTKFVEVRIPKAVIAVESVTVLPEKYPSMLLVGLGPGQFSSRAALIGTGMYYEKFRTIFPSGMSKPFKKYVLEPWLTVRAMETPGSTWKPFASWISFYTEFGVVAVIALIFWIWRLLRRVLKSAQDKYYRQGIVVVTLILFLFLFRALLN